MNNHQDEDFTIIIRSVDCRGQFPENRAGSFTNNINDKISLSGNYEVALQNIIYKPEFDAILKHNKRFSIWFTINFYNENSESYSGTSFLYTPLINIGSSHTSNCVRQLNQDLMDNLRVNKIIDHTHPPVLRYDARVNMVKYNKLTPPKKSKIMKYESILTFSKAMGEVLGLQEDTNSSSNPIFSRPVSIKIPESIFIYTDIIKATNIGDQSVNILDILPNTQMYAKNTVSPVYKQVNTSFIDTISLKLVDEFGSEVPFHQSVRVTAVLHFRRRI
jgi:hypothetical protein